MQVSSFTTVHITAAHPSFCQCHHSETYISLDWLEKYSGSWQETKRCKSPPAATYPSLPAQPHRRGAVATKGTAAAWVSLDTLPCCSAPPCLAGMAPWSLSSTHHTETQPGDTDALAADLPQQIQGGIHLQPFLEPSGVLLGLSQTIPMS